MERKLFGTDGIRGVAGEPPLDPTTIFVLGQCLGEYLRRSASHRRVVLGEDTRESSRWIAETVAAGFQQAGVETWTTGIITTPGVAYLAASEGLAAGVMISASHNPYQDNGIKVFASTGFKLPDEDELKIEQRVFAMLATDRVPNSFRLSAKADRALVEKYVQFLRRAAAASSWNLPNWKLVVDCANGSAAILARDVFSDLGVELVLLADQPDGRNINLDCGSLHLEYLQKAVLQEKAHVGVALDGDGDRALFVTASGRVVNGDGVLLAASRYLRRRGRLQGGAVVGTVMSNLGLERALALEGLRLLRTPVGDKYVLEEMRRAGINLGGEQSGHIIFSDLATTGDGLLTALQMLRMMAEEKKPLEELVEGLEEFPQTIRNIRVREKVRLESLPRVQEQIQASEQSLGDSGRIVVRYSGTELLARVMVEAVSAEAVDRHASAIARAIQETIGADSSDSR